MSRRRDRERRRARKARASGRRGAAGGRAASAGGFKVDRPGDGTVRARMGADDSERGCALALGAMLALAGGLASVAWARGGPKAEVMGWLGALSLAAAMSVALFAALGRRTWLDPARQRVRTARTVLGVPVVWRTRPLGAPRARVLALGQGWVAGLEVEGEVRLRVGPYRVDRGHALADARLLVDALRCEGIRVDSPTTPAPAAPSPAPPGPLPGWARALPADGRGGACPLCRDPLSGADPALDLVACAGCATAYHAACALEVGRCAVLGCAHAVDRRGLLPA